MKRLSLLALATLLLLVPVSTASAQKPAAKPSASASPKAAAPTTIWDHQKELGLTDEQVTQIKAAVQQLQSQLKQAETQGDTVRQDLSGMVSDDTVDIEKVRTKWMQLATIQVDAHIADLQASRAIHKILSPEQLARWQQIQAAAKAKKK